MCYTHYATCSWLHSFNVHSGSWLAPSLLPFRPLTLRLVTHPRAYEPAQWLSLSQTTLPQIKPSSLPLPGYVTRSTVATRTSWGLKRSSRLLAPSDTKGRPAKTMKRQHLSLNYTKFDDWNLDLSRLPLRHQHPLTSPIQHLLFRETRKSRRVLRPPAPECAQWPAD